MKVCRICELSLSIEKFDKNKGTKDGLDSRCKSCKKAMYLKNREKYLAESKVRYQNNKDKMNSSRSELPNFLDLLLKCKKKDREHLTAADLIDIYNRQGGKCAITKIDMTHIHGEGRIDTNISLDRIDSDLGYKLDNIQLVCYRVNLIKNNLNQEDLHFWCRKILEG